MSCLLFDSSVAQPHRRLGGCLGGDGVPHPPGGLVGPPQQVTREGPERRPLPPLCPDRSGRRARSWSRGKGPASQRTAQCHGCSQLAPWPVLPASRRPSSLTLSACLPLPALPSLFISGPPFPLMLPSPFYLNPPFSSLFPSFLPPPWAWRRMSVVVSQAQSLSGSVP